MKRPWEGEGGGGMRVIEAAASPELPEGEIA